MSASKKPHLNIVVTGHVDNGKSTTVGHLLVDLGAIDQRTIDAYAKESEATGKGDTFKYAWVMDSIKDERERGITIDLAFQKFETSKYFFTLIDAPGHKDFIKNMITGASEADAAILVISVKPGETEASIEPGGQGREHAFLAKTLGVGQIVVALNKMDDVGYQEARYKEVKDSVEKMLKSVGFNVAKVNFVPVSGWKGDNLVKRGDNMPWYKGPTLAEALDAFEPPEKPIGKPLRVPIQDVYTITGVGTVPVGRVETGKMRPNDKVVVMPSGAVGEIKSIETHHTVLESAEAGDNVGFNLRGVDKKQIKRGDIIGPADNPPAVAKEFEARIIVISHPTAIAPGYTPVLHAHTAQVAATISHFVSKIDPRTGATTEENPKFLKTGDAAIVKIKPVRPLAIETFKDFPEIGRFALRDMGTTIAAGVVLNITEKYDPNKK
ncbi:translation elongation factor EF-1 subunit alpha [Nitrososphaera viennensis]|uniref:Elongation factor 1-alpha n=2 Tax=Nitrososphaera viennensis TaxID=1034015 RepID=A0A060HQ54_9ARCH|nr:translation elongation factor EF-1 subunit alpha [Nitrososphaera viennensis]AIC15681.1 translation elongation factor EF-1 alpha [Nitrososphaera viennensis EN76]UVS70554.1 translation elongation factor EF-1 subunit alpha [Nitrososphaera viennensis]